MSGVWLRLGLWLSWIVREMGWLGDGIGLVDALCWQEEAGVAIHKRWNNLASDP